ncbi:RNA-directed DNA polymerase, eukaryota [Tanacetum coccineum]
MGMEVLRTVKFFTVFLTRSAAISEFEVSWQNVCGIDDLGQVERSDRQILDGPFILNEVLQWCRKKRKHALIFKVDFEKAYDSVRWDFLDDVLDKFGFGVKWRNWIQSCLRSSRGSILINGSPTKEFQSFEVLYKVTPLSPFLFILLWKASAHFFSRRVVDAEDYLMELICAPRWIFSFVLRMTPIFKWSWMTLNIDTLVRVLECFFRASGLRINMSKSKIMANKLGCLVLKTLHLLEMEVPSSILNSLEVIRSRFFNGHEHKSNKATWFKWNKVLTSKEKGGLGVSSLFALNRGLLFKWFVAVLFSKDSLLDQSDIMELYYGEDGSLDKVGASAARNVGLQSSGV